MHSQTKDDSVVVFASAAKATLLSEQICILLIRFLVKRRSVHLRIAITSAENTVERLPIDMLSL
jgi:hypothetical protein